MMMVKLQRIIRSNGSAVHSINIPLEIIEGLKWTKGDELHIFRELGTKNIIIKKEVQDGDH